MVWTPFTNILHIWGGVRGVDKIMFSEYNVSVQLGMCLMPHMIRGIICPVVQIPIYEVL